MLQNIQKNRKWLLFFLYAAWMLWLLLARSPGGQGKEYWEAVGDNMNLEPFRTIRGYWSHLARYEYYMDRFGPEYAYHARQAIRNLGGNVILFIPLGYFLPRLWKPLRKWWRTWLTAALLVMAVEMTQLLTLRGSCDVDDLILNLAGAAMGYGFFRLWCLTKYAGDDIV